MNAHNLAPVAPICTKRDMQRKLICYRCNEWHPIAESWPDFAGPAFRAFYCTPCAAQMKLPMPKAPTGDRPKIDLG